MFDGGKDEFMGAMIIDRWFEDRRTALACMTMGLLIGALSLGGQELAAQLRYDRDALLAGEYWRALSGHLVHASLAHTGLNMAGLLLIALLFPEPIPLLAWAWRLLLLSLGVSGLIFWRVPELGWYVGLSGVLHGFFVLGFWWLFRQGDRFSLILLLVLMAKLGWEHLYGPITSNEDLVGVPVLVEAHSYGALSAVVYILCREAWRGLRPDPHPPRTDH